MDSKNTAKQGVGSTGGSAFKRWFNQQWGTKPPMTNDQYLKLRNDTIPSLRHQLIEAESSLEKMDRYNTAKQFALYAWCARDKPNPKV